ncbi:MAG: DUF1801 domain-containing protein [Bacteroidia bacterium]|nr:DUF1801 domain-containing protein [Bacteroidia bacterium]
MSQLKINRDPRVEPKFQSYPDEIRGKLEALRDLILEVADETEGVTEILETLKWGEPSYLVKNGSTLRMDWKPQNPGQYAMYFQCTSQLVPTFKVVYGDKFRYEGTRALLFDLEEKIPRQELKDCIQLALNYHKLKHLPLLGK